MPHGVDPSSLLWDAGWSLVRWLSVSVTDADEVRVSAQVRAVRPGDEAPEVRTRGREPRRRGAEPVVKQRLACYGIVLSDQGLLATRFARSVGTTTWGLPGGGREDGEAPSDTVLREIGEETGQVARLGRLLDLRSDHWVGRAPSGVVEDFHALRLIYSAHVDSPTTPVVHDVGGTTAEATWVPLDRWRSLPWAVGSRNLLEAHLPALVR